MELRCQFFHNLENVWKDIQWFLKIIFVRQYLEKFSKVFQMFIFRWNLGDHFQNSIFLIFLKLGMPYIQNKISQLKMIKWALMFSPLVVKNIVIILKSFILSLPSSSWTMSYEYRIFLIFIRENLFFIPSQFLFPPALTLKCYVNHSIFLISCTSCYFISKEYIVWFFPIFDLHISRTYCISSAPGLWISNFTNSSILMYMVIYSLIFTSVQYLVIWIYYLLSILLMEICLLAIMQNAFSELIILYFYFNIKILLITLIDYLNVKTLLHSWGITKIFVITYFFLCIFLIHSAIYFRIFAFWSISIIASQCFLLELSSDFDIMVDEILKRYLRSVVPETCEYEISLLWLCYVLCHRWS